MEDSSDVGTILEQRCFANAGSNIVETTLEKFEAMMVRIDKTLQTATLPTSFNICQYYQSLVCPTLRADLTIANLVSLTILSLNPRFISVLPGL